MFIINKCSTDALRARVKKEVDMAISQQQINIAKAVQDASAHDPASQIRLVAGPGTGKSFSIGERVSWLINNGVNPRSIYAVSFTRAAANDLEKGIISYCRSIPSVTQINVSTLHSLALKIMARGGQLAQYPTSPRIIDDWEQRYIFNEELKDKYRYSISRCDELRIHFESIWSTGNPPQPFISSPTPAISLTEEINFKAFHRERTQVYATILPGEAVRQCVDHMKAGIINPRILIGMEHLIIDEYQDLNNCDVEFIDLLAKLGIPIFVAGDDDQSIYSFRYAFPAGIQTFPSRYTNSGLYALQMCFRCTPSVLQTSLNVLAQYSPQSRIPKQFTSAYTNSSPPVQGTVIGISYIDDDIEAHSIAQSVKDLVDNGISPEDILILLSNRPAQLQKIEAEIIQTGVKVDVSQKISFADENVIRFIYSMLRIIKNPNDYIAHRSLLSLQFGIGIKTCVSITDKIIANTCNYLDQFGTLRSSTLFSRKENACLDKVMTLKNTINGWTLNELISSKEVDIENLIMSFMSVAQVTEWQNWISQLPASITLEDVLNILGTRSENDVRLVLVELYNRLNEPLPEGFSTINRVRIMTLHSAKGLSAKIVFIPGLEEELLPGARRAPYPAQVQEAARLLYVGITRARSCCIISYASSRFINGMNKHQTASRYALSTGLVFNQRALGLSPSEIAQICTDCKNL